MCGAPWDISGQLIPAGWGEGEGGQKGNSAVKGNMEGAPSPRAAPFTLHNCFISTGSVSQNEFHYWCLGYHIDYQFHRFLSCQLAYKLAIWGRH